METGQQRQPRPLQEVMDHNCTAAESSPTDRAVTCTQLQYRGRIGEFCSVDCAPCAYAAAVQSLLLRYRDSKCQLTNCWYMPAICWLTSHWHLSCVFAPRGNTEPAVMHIFCCIMILGWQHLVLAWYMHTLAAMLLLAQQAVLAAT